MGTYKGKYASPRERSLKGLFLFLVGLVLYSSLLQFRTMIPRDGGMNLPFGWGTAIVLSDSMVPTFKKGDLLLLKEVEEPKIGDVVVYGRDKSLIVHRIIELEDEYIITQGDANNAPDPPVSRAQVRAVVAGKFPGLGRVAQVIQTPAGSMAAVFIPILLMEISLLQDRRTAKRTKREIMMDIQFMREETNRIISKMEER